jgi:hypothetical protein
LNHLRDQLLKDQYGQSISRTGVADLIVKLLAQPTPRPALAFIAD